MRAALAEDASRLAELVEACAIHALKAVRSKVQAQRLTEVSGDQADRIMGARGGPRFGSAFAAGLGPPWTGREELRQWARLRFRIA